MFVQGFMYVKYSGVLNTFIAFIMAFCYQQNCFSFLLLFGQKWAHSGETNHRENCFQTLLVIQARS